MTQFRATLTGLVLFAMCSAGQAQTFTERVVRGFDSSVYAAAPAGDTNRLFVLEQETGDIRILDLTSGEIAADPFLTVPRLSTGGEKGLLGLAFHPDYASNGNFYVYASQPGGRDHRSQVFEYSVVGDPATSSLADADSQRSILRFDQPFSNHNGGWIGFDPTAQGDARNQLFVATGDGGSANDPENNSQDLSSLLGKMLRIDVASDAFPSDSIQNYSIPASNPFVDTDGSDEIFAYGLRNPWRSSFDPKTGDLWIGDVGQREVEEIDVLPAGTSGQNYGWRVMEGTECFNTGDSRDGNLQCDDPSLTPPVYEYGHGGGEFRGNSVTGGYVYRGPLKEFQGQYFFGDFASGHIWTRDPDSGKVINQDDALEANLGSASSRIASFAEDGRGDLYVVNYGGSLYRVDSTSRDARWVGADPNSGTAGDGTTWSDANNWDRDGVADTAFVDGDHLIVGADVQSAEARRVSALTFDSSSSFASSANLGVVSGNISVAAGQNASLSLLNEGKIVSPVGAIRKMGEGHLDLVEPASDSPIYLKEGSATIVGAAGMIVVGTDATLRQSEGGTAIEVLDGELGIVHLTPVINEAGFLVSQPLLDIGTLTGTHRLTVGATDVSLERGQQTKVTLLTATESNLTNGEFEKVRLEQFGELNVPGHQGFGSVVTVDMVTNLDGGAELVLSVMKAYPGDTNLDGTVGFDDFLILSSNFGEIGGWERGDFGDGVVAFSDFLDLTNNFGLTVTDVEAVAPMTGAAPVPEPSADLLAVLGLMTLLVVRRSR